MIKSLRRFTQVCAAYAQRLSSVCAAFAQRLRSVCAAFAQRLHNVCAEFAHVPKCLHMVCAIFAQSLRRVRATFAQRLLNVNVAQRLRERGFANSCAQTLRKRVCAAFAQRLRTGQLADVGGTPGCAGHPPGQDAVDAGRIVSFMLPGVCRMNLKGIPGPGARLLGISEPCCSYVYVFCSYFKNG